jgi:hypothetical protein
MTTSPELDNLVRTGQLKHTAPDADEYKALVHSGEARLTDAAKKNLALESRFDLAYNAAHALSLAALRRLGYRSESRYTVFQACRTRLAFRRTSGACSPNVTVCAIKQSTRVSSSSMRRS